MQNLSRWLYAESTSIFHFIAVVCCTRVTGSPHSASPELGCAVYYIQHRCSLPRVYSWNSLWWEKTTLLSAKIGGVWGVIWGYERSQWLFPNYTSLFIHKRFPAISHSLLPPAVWGLSLNSFIISNWRLWFRSDCFPRFLWLTSSGFYRFVLSGYWVDDVWMLCGCCCWFSCVWIFVQILKHSKAFLIRNK